MASSKSSKSKNGASMDAVDLLMDDHKEVEKLFKSFEKNKEQKGVEDIITTACAELKAHSQIEKEIFYPAVYAKADKELKELLDEAEVEHEAVDNLVFKLSEIKLADDMYKANFTVLVEFVKHHVKEEEEEMFPKVRKLKGLDLEGLGKQMLQRKEELMSELVGEMPTSDSQSEFGVDQAMRSKASKSKTQRVAR